MFCLNSLTNSLFCHSCKGTFSLQCVYWNQGHPDNENQSEGRTGTIDSNIFKSSQSNAQYKTMKSQCVCWPVMFTRLWCRLNVKLKPVVLLCVYGFRNNFMVHSVYFRSLVDLEYKSKSATCNYIAWVLVESLLSWRSKKALQMVCEQFHSNNFHKAFEELFSRPEIFKPYIRHSDDIYLGVALLHNSCFLNQPIK